jgi:hypothetical protein
MSKLRVKLFTAVFESGDDADDQTLGIHKMEDRMNKFLEYQIDKDDHVKKIYVALSASRAMGLIEYKADD